MPTAKLCKRKRGDTAACREEQEIKIIRKSDCAQTRSLADRDHIDRFEENRNGGIIYIKTRPKPFPYKMTIKLKSAWRKNRFDGFPCSAPAILPRHFAPAISLPPFRPAISPPPFRPCYFAPLFRPAISPRYFASPIPRKQDDKKSKRKSFRIHLNRTTTEKATRKF